MTMNDWNFLDAQGLRPSFHANSEMTMTRDNLIIVGFLFLDPSVHTQIFFFTAIVNCGLDNVTSQNSTNSA